MQLRLTDEIERRDGLVYKAEKIVPKSKETKLIKGKNVIVLLNKSDLNSLVNENIIL